LTWNQALHFWPFDLFSADPWHTGMCSQPGRLALVQFKRSLVPFKPVVPRISLPLCKNRLLSVTMKASLMLAVALLLPVIVNAQSSVNVSGVCPTVLNLRLVGSPP
jgi:hypothetical protein